MEVLLTSSQDLQEGEVGMKVYKLCAVPVQQQGTPRSKMYTGEVRCDIPLSRKVVLHLMETGSLFGLEQFFVDNWYTLPSLYHML